MLKISKFEITKKSIFATSKDILNTAKLVEIYIACDDFVKFLAQYQLHHAYSLEAMRLTHHSGFKCFKYLYDYIVQEIVPFYFSESYSYYRFVDLGKTP